MSKYIGSFVFRNEGNGCLTSRYLEHTETTPYTESCKKINDDSKSEDPFVGIYKTSWLESGNNDYTAELTINKQKDTYILTWRNLSKNSTTEYDGSAMIFEDKLVGSYWSK